MARYRRLAPIPQLLARHRRDPPDIPDVHIEKVPEFLELDMAVGKRDVDPVWDFVQRRLQGWSIRGASAVAGQKDFINILGIMIIAHRRGDAGKSVRPGPVSKKRDVGGVFDARRRVERHSIR